jgi:hypothetical protein
VATYLPVQDGDAALGAWNDSNAILNAKADPFGSHIGLVFDTAGLPIVSGEVRLTLDVLTDQPEVAGLQLWWVPESAPADFSVGDLPGTRNELLVAEALYTGEAPGTHVHLMLGQTYNAATQIQIDAALSQLIAMTGTAGWSGRIAFTVEALSGSTLRFEASESAGTPPTLDVVEVSPSEVVSLAQTAKLIRQTLIARLNADPTLQALSLEFEDMVGRAIEDVNRNERRGFVGTHPETVLAGSDRHMGPTNVRVLEVLIVVAVGAKGATEAANLLDDAEEAIVRAIDSEPTLSGLVPGHLSYSQAVPAHDANGRRDYGTRAITYLARYARKGAA